MHREVQITFEMSLPMFQRVMRSADKTLSALLDVSFDARCISESIYASPPRPGHSINGRKYPDLDWPKAIERAMWHPPLPGTSKICRKPSDLDWPKATECSLWHPPLPGTSKICRKSSDLESSAQHNVISAIWITATQTWPELVNGCVEAPSEQTK